MASCTQSRERSEKKFIDNKTALPSRDIAREWYVIDAEGQRLGRLATEIAKILRGKNKPSFTPNMDTGDYVIVINAEKVVVTGKKNKQKQYRRHSGRPGGMKVETFDQLQNRIPERIIEQAVKGMLPKTPLGRKLFTKLKVYTGTEHPHQAQRPQLLTIQTIPPKKNEKSKTKKLSQNNYGVTELRGAISGDAKISDVQGVVKSDTKRKFTTKSVSNSFTFSTGIKELEEIIAEVKQKSKENPTFTMPMKQTKLFKGYRAFSFSRRYSPDKKNPEHYLNLSDLSPELKPEEAAENYKDLFIAEATRRRLIWSSKEKADNYSFVQKNIIANNFGKTVEFKQIFRHLSIYDSCLTVEMDEMNRLQEINCNLAFINENISFNSQQVGEPEEACIAVKKDLGEHSNGKLSSSPQLYLYYSQSTTSWVLAYIFSGVSVKTTHESGLIFPVKFDIVVDSHKMQIIDKLEWI